MKSSSKFYKFTNSFVKIIIASGILVSCATSNKVETQKTSTQSLIDQNKKVNTDLYFESFEFKPFVLSKNSSKCLQPGEIKKKDWATLLENLNQCALQNQWFNVENNALELLRVEVNAPWGPYFLSLAAENRSDLARALWMIDLAIKKASSDIAAFHYQRGRVLWLLDQKESAKQEMQKTTQLNSKFADAYLFLAELTYRELDYKQSISLYQKAIDNEITATEAFQNISECYFALSDYVNTQKYLSLGVSKHPESLNMRLKLAQLYEDQLKDTQQAIMSYTSLKEALKKGQVQGPLKFDINEKIKILEAQWAKTQADRKPAQAKGG